jgi:hypothetical protein
MFYHYLCAWEGLGWVTKTLCTQNEANAFSLWNNNLGYQGILEYLSYYYIKQYGRTTPPTPTTTPPTTPPPPPQLLNYSKPLSDLSEIYRHDKGPIRIVPVEFVFILLEYPIY